MHRFSSKNKRVLVHAQQSEPVKGAPGRRSVLLDVADDSEHDLIAQVAQSVPTQMDADRQKASMLRLEYAPDGRRGLREGSWYEVDLNVWSEMRYAPVSRDAPGGAYLGGTLVAPEVALNFSQFLSKRRYIDGSIGSVDLPPPKMARKGEPLLTVVDCGQGNWNEVSAGNLRVIYDTGACRNYDEKQLRQLITTRHLLAEYRQIVVFISHWDIDHYHALLKFSPAELSKISHVYAPDRLPNTATLKRVQALLAANSVPLTLLPTQPHPDGKGPIQLVPMSHFGPFTVLRATAGSSTNQTGIALQAEGPRRLALLTGDHYYSKVLAASSGATGKACELVVPHHGGECGVLNQQAWSMKHPNIRATISVGQNSWKHPRLKYVNALTSLQGSAPWRTDKHGTYRRLL